MFSRTFFSPPVLSSSVFRLEELKDVFSFFTRFSNSFSFSANDSFDNQSITEEITQ